MSRIQCFMVERTEARTPCDCGDPTCTQGDRPWKRVDTGEIIDSRQDLPPGAMWWAPWYQDHYAGFDGKCLVVMTPGGEWIIDSQAGNCTRKGDKTHRCWCRSGEAPNITVGKEGNTCSAGAGSILIDSGNRSYHGFLRNGYLESC